MDFLILRYKEKLVVTRAASQWLFEGMKDSLLDFIKQYNPQLVPFDKFGWFYDRNKSSTYDGRFNIKTGEDNIWNLGLIYEWNYHHKTNFFRKECGIVNGTTSEIFAPLNSTANTLSIFLSDFCRCVFVRYSKFKGNHFHLS